MMWFSSQMVPFIAFVILFSEMTGADAPSGNTQQESTRMIESDIQDVIFFSESRPLILRLRIHVDGISFRAHWYRRLKHQFDEVDSNGDGAWSRKETQHSPGSEGPASTASVEDLLRIPRLWNADVAPFDGKITLVELAELLSGQKNGPLQNNAGSETALMLSPRTFASANTGEELFDLIDGDRNGLLSDSDFQTAVESFRKHDLDNDEAISINELQASQNPFANFSLQLGQVTETPFTVLDQNTSPTRIIGQLLDRYRSNKNEPEDSGTRYSLNQSEIKLEKSVFDQFDTDADGNLDDDELRRFLKNPVPSVELIVRLGKRRKSEPVVDVVKTVAGSNVKFRESAGIISLVVGDVQIEIGADSSTGIGIKDSMLAQFRRFDADNNNYLDKKEADSFPFFKSYFDDFDRDGDEKLYENELSATVDEKLQKAGSRTRLAIMDRGQDLFTIMDADRNLAIGQREFLEASKRIELWDKNDDGKISAGEIPRLYHFSLGRGMPTFPGFRIPSPLRNGAAAARSSTRFPSGPRWFERMNKNGDGDLSPNEFLGTRDCFRKLDKNNDGLVDAEEASFLQNNRK